MSEEYLQLETESDRLRRLIRELDRKYVRAMCFLWSSIAINIVLLVVYAQEMFFFVVGGE